VVLSNHKIHAEHPALTDIAPTILAEFGIATPDTMKGRSIFEPSRLKADRGAATPDHRGKSY
jgi:arylsulfatase A-like enzyme